MWGSYEEFLAKRKLSFDNPNRLEVARDSLDTLIEGNEKTAAFLAKFRALQVEAQFTVNQLWSRLWSAVQQKTRHELKRTRSGISKYNSTPPTEKVCYILMHQAGKAVEESEREKKISEAHTMALNAFKNKGQSEGNQSMGPVSLPPRDGPLELLVGVPDAHRDRRTRRRLQVCLVLSSGSFWDVNT